MRRLLTLFGSVLAGTTLFAAAPAAGVAWGTLEAYDGGIKRAEAYGGFYNDSYVDAKMRATYRDTYADGDAVFTDYIFMWYGPFTTCEGSCWYNGKAGQTERVGTGAGWVTRYDTQGLKSTGSQARLNVHVCSDQSWEPDACSPRAYPTFSY